MPSRKISYSIWYIRNWNVSTSFNFCYCYSTSCSDDGKKIIYRRRRHRHHHQHFKTIRFVRLDFTLFSTYLFVFAGLHHAILHYKDTHKAQSNNNKNEKESNDSIKMIKRSKQIANLHCEEWKTATKKEYFDSIEMHTNKHTKWIEFEDIHKTVLCLVCASVHIDVELRHLNSYGTYKHDLCSFVYIKNKKWTTTTKIEAFFVCYAKCENNNKTTLLPFLFTSTRNTPILTLLDGSMPMTMSVV